MLQKARILSGSDAFVLVVFAGSDKAQSRWLLKRAVIKSSIQAISEEMGLSGWDTAGLGSLAGALSYVCFYIPTVL